MVTAGLHAREGNERLEKQLKGLERISQELSRQKEKLDNEERLRAKEMREKIEEEERLL